MSEKIIVGFRFDDEELSKKALQELNIIVQIQEKEQFADSKNRLFLFNHLIEESCFTTPVGIEFLRKMQKELYEDETIDHNQIKSIPISNEGSARAENAIDNKDKESFNNNINVKKEDKQNSNITNKEDRKQTIKNIEKQTSVDKVTNANKNKVKKTKGNIHNNEKSLNSKKNIYKEKFVKSLIINIVFIIVITTMFIINHRSKKYDLNYYRESIENEYMNWENNLKERESIINDKENPS